RPFSARETPGGTQVHTSRSGPAAAGCLSLSIAFAQLLLPATLLAADTTVSGIVVDQAGHALPRAHVRAIDSASREISSLFTDESGRFRLILPEGPCEVTASLTGFEAMSVACGAEPLRILLSVAPVRETVVVTATRTAAPAGQVGASVTVFTADDLAARDVPLAADLIRSSPGVVLMRAGGGPGTVTSLFVRG